MCDYHFYDIGSAFDIPQGDVKCIYYLPMDCMHSLIHAENIPQHHIVSLYASLGKCNPVIIKTVQIVNGKNMFLTKNLFGTDFENGPNL